MGPLRFAMTTQPMQISHYSRTKLFVTYFAKMAGRAEACMTAATKLAQAETLITDCAALADQLELSAATSTERTARRLVWCYEMTCLGKRC